MDFFGILFDMKNGKKVPYSKTYFDTLFAESLAGVTTLTGTLPLTFTTSETALRSWTIYGADIEHVETATGKSITFYTDEDKLRDWTVYGNAEGVGERTKNLLEITATSQTINGVTFTVDKLAGTVTLNGKATAQSVLTVCDKLMKFDGSEIISGSPNDVSGSTYFTNVQYQNTGAHGANNNYVGTGEVAFSGLSNFNNPVTAIKIYVRNGTICNNVVFRLMIRPADTTPDFIPYGYEIPLTISQTGQTDKNYDIFVGDSPLTEGETVSKTSTGVDITTQVGENTISTTLDNKPEMSVYYGYKGAGVHDGNTWEFNFISQANGNQQLTRITMDKPLRAGETLTSEQASVTIPTYANAENTLSLYPSAAGYGNPTMTITYKGG